jgi:alpha-D-ribose 1-methylphosphonate 5-triphosphate synthase subunit PhnL
MTNIRHPSERRVLSVRGLSKHFVLHSLRGRLVHALHDIDLEVCVGEHVVLAGPSGAGKSSLLRCIYRTYEPSAGEVWLRLDDGIEVDLARLPDTTLARLRGREIGYVSQFLRAEPRRGALDIVARAGAWRGMDRSTALDAAAHALRLLNIDEPLWDVNAGVLSGGEKQRVNLAAGTISPPRLLLLDEPLSALDPANRDAAIEHIDRLRGAGVAVLAVFHDHAAMERLANRVVVMREGRIVGDGLPAETLATVAGGAP